MGDDPHFDAGADDISLDDESSVLYNAFYAILGVKENDSGDYFVKIKNVLADLDWEGPSVDNIDKWRENKLVVKMMKNKVVKLASKLKDPEGEEKEEELESEGEDEEELQQLQGAVWLSLKDFAEKFDQIFVCKTEPMKTGKFVSIFCTFNNK